MTKYILQSGGINRNKDGAKRYAVEMVKGLGISPRILVCLFAQPREYWEHKFAEDIANYSEWFPNGVKPDFQLAMPDRFVEQVKWCDVLYIRGGDNTLLRYWLAKYDIPELFEGKVVSVISAGADALVKYYWTCDWREAHSGLGVLPVKFIPHYMSDFGSDDPRGPIDWEKAYDELKKLGDSSLPIHALREGEFVVYEV